MTVLVTCRVVAISSSSGCLFKPYAGFLYFSGKTGGTVFQNLCVVKNANLLFKKSSVSKDGTLLNYLYLTIRSFTEACNIYAGEKLWNSFLNQSP